MYQYLVISRNKSDLVESYSKSNNKYKQNNIIQMFDLLIDNTFVQLIYWSTTPLSSLLDMCFNKQLVFQCVQIVLSYSLVDLYEISISKMTVYMYLILFT